MNSIRLFGLVSTTVIVLVACGCVSGCKKSPTLYGWDDVCLEENVKRASYFLATAAVDNVYMYYKRRGNDEARLLLWMLMGCSMDSPKAVQDFESDSMVKSPQFVLSRLKGIHLQPYEREVLLEDNLNDLVRIAEQTSVNGESLSLGRLKGCFSVRAITPAMQFYLSTNALEYLSSKALRQHDSDAAYRVGQHYGYYKMDFGRQAVWLAISELYGSENARKELSCLYHSKRSLEVLREDMKNVILTDWEKSQEVISVVAAEMVKHQCLTINELRVSVHDAIVSDFDSNDCKP